MVPVTNEIDGSVTQLSVGVEYSAVPLSCGYCCAFGHSESPCDRKPNYQKINDSNVNGVETSKAASKRTRHGKKDDKDTFLGCDVEPDLVAKESEDISMLQANSDTIVNPDTIVYPVHHDNQMPNEPLASPVSPVVNNAPHAPACVIMVKIIMSGNEAVNSTNGLEMEENTTIDDVVVLPVLSKPPLPHGHS
ncbi:hypothetical protein POM88_000500 [Heracleum sosnowskyi]|uniref:Uncharacterized protein n=1 Tax=Heracleum sosnowskyi TaxID=360622 RepID=A0AAD8JAH0_9APIA|nr:hypothetical protein POM88_000500 [Heracleum sosnowskyi]